MRKMMRLAALAAVAGMGLISTAHAAVVASDSASNNPPYVPGNSFSGQNGGTGFDPWVLVASPEVSYRGAFVNSSDTGGQPNWNIYASENDYITAYRGFTGGALVPGQSVTVTGLTLNSLNNGASGGFSLNDGNNGNNTLLRVYAVGGTSGYAVNDATGNFQGYQDGTLPGYNYQSQLSFTFTLNDALGNYTLTTSTGTTHTGQVDLTGGSITNFSFFDNNGGGSSDIQLEGLSVTGVPEPTTFAALSLGATALLRRRR